MVQFSAKLVLGMIFKVASVKIALQGVASALD